MSRNNTKVSPSQPSPKVVSGVRTDANVVRTADEVVDVPADSSGELVFGPGWNEQCVGPIVAGGKVSVAYDLERFPQLVTRVVDGSQVWGVKACVMAVPSGVVQERELVEFGVGANVAGPRVVPQVFDVPEGSVAVEVWFRNWAGVDEDHVAWDSNFGQNYVFEVEVR